MCFPMPMFMLGYFGFQRKIFKLWSGVEKTGYYGPKDEYNYSLYDNMCVMTSCLFELSFAFTIVLLLSTTDYNQRAIVQHVPCWEREFVLPRFKEEILINKMKILVMQFTLIIAFGFAWPPTIIIVTFFNIYDMRRDAELCTLHYRRPLLLKNNSFDIWTEILKLMIYIAIIVNVLSLVCSSDTIEAYLVEKRRPVGDNQTLFYYLGLFFRHEHTLHKSFTSYFVMFAIFMLSQFIFSFDVDELEIPRKRSQQQSEAKALQDITEYNDK
ncbi:hypothetical protein RR48_04637 [Papilio machaon]|uniref:Anoctamin n=1 Tax=Papilio machaon TaxID=76193 RepID=A0A0N1PHE8_PAPMA|nr:hypothetical protein RR48_04637 [Papilio machaon]